MFTYGAIFSESEYLTATHYIKVVYFSIRNFKQQYYREKVCNFFKLILTN